MLTNLNEKVEDIAFELEGYRTSENGPRSHIKGLRKDAKFKEMDSVLFDSEDKDLNWRTNPFGGIQARRILGELK